MYEISSCMKFFLGSMYEISSSMKTFFCSMYGISSYYDRDFLIHEIFISWRFHDPYPQGGEWMQVQIAAGRFSPASPVEPCRHSSLPLLVLGMVFSCWRDAALMHSWKPLPWLWMPTIGRRLLGGNCSARFWQVVTRHFLLGRCWHLGSTLDVNTYLNDIRFGRCWHLGSTLDVNTYQKRYCFGRCQHLPKEVLLW